MNSVRPCTRQIVPFGGPPVLGKVAKRSRTLSLVSKKPARAPGGTGLEGTLARTGTSGAALSFIAFLAIESAQTR